MEKIILSVNWVRLITIIKKIKSKLYLWLIIQIIFIAISFCLKIWIYQDAANNKLSFIDNNSAPVTLLSIVI